MPNELPPGMTTEADPIDSMIGKAEKLVEQMRLTTLPSVLQQLLTELYTRDTQCGEALPILTNLAATVSQFRHAYIDSTKKVTDLEGQLTRLREEHSIDAVVTEIATNGQMSEPADITQKSKRA